MPGPLVKTRLLMYGHDEGLMSIRARVLATIGCETTLLWNVEQARQQLAPGAAKPALLVICHTAGAETATQVRSLALQAGVPTYYVEKLVPPKQMIADVRTLLGEQRRELRAGSGSV